MNNLTDQFISYLFDLTKINFEQKSLHQARRCLLDYLAVAYAGTELSGEKSRKYILNTTNSEGGVHVIGYKERKAIETAAFLNAFNAHIAELDDGVNSGIVHPGSPLISALLPIAEFKEVSTSDFLRGIVVGYEAIIRLANAIQPSHKKKGYHASGTCGCIGTAIGISAMLNLSKEEMKSAFSAATIVASGSLKALEDNSEFKPFNVANAAATAVNAYLIAASGFIGPEDVLSGPKGFLNMMTDEFRIQQLIPSGAPLAIESIYIKPYAACRYCHPSIEAAILLKSNNGFDVSDLKEIEVSTYELAVKNHDHTEVDSVSSAKMSIPYSVALSLNNGSAGLLDFSNKNIEDTQIAELSRKIKVNSDPGYTEAFPKKSVAKVSLLLTDGTMMSETVEFPKGEPENPLSDGELEQKFTELLGFAGKQPAEINHLKNLVFDPNLEMKTLLDIL